VTWVKTTSTVETLRIVEDGNQPEDLLEFVPALDEADAVEMLRGRS
jgi:hypothetical protein